MGSGSLERAIESLVPSNISMRASTTSDTATLVCLNMATPQLRKRNVCRGDRICADYGPNLVANTEFGDCAEGQR
jgi:hypothetical protein